MPAILNKFILRKAQNWTSEAAFFKLCNSQAVFMWHHSVQLKIDRKEKNLQLTFASFTSSAKCIFSNWLSTSLSSMLSLLGFGTHLAWHNTAREQPWPRVVVKRLVGSHEQNPFSGMMLRKHGLAAEYCSKWQQWCQILSFFEDEFYKLRKTCTSEAETLACD